MQGKRIWWVLGGLAVLALALAMGAVAGGGLVYALTRSGGRISVAAAQGRDPGYGIVVAAVESGGPADKAGVVRGDILLEVAGERIENRAELVRALRDLEPGDEVELLVLHGDEQRALSLTPDEGDGRAYLGLTPCGGLAAPTVEWIEPGELSTGALVVDVTDGSPADEAGLQAGDVITALDGNTVDAENGLASRIAAYRPGDTVSLTIERSGEEPRDVSVELGSQPDDEDSPYLGVRYRPSPLSAMPGLDWLPFRQFRDLPFDELPFAFPEGDIAGVIVQHVIEGSPAETAGLDAGDVITALDGESVESAQGLTESIAARAPGDQVTLTVVRLSSGDERQVEVTLATHPDEDGKAYLGVYLGGYFRMPSTEENGGTLRRWFFGPGTDGEDMPRGFEFRWPWQNPDDDSVGDDVGNL